MDKLEMKLKWNVDVTKVAFNGDSDLGYFVGSSRELDDADRHYIQVIDGDYSVVSAATNQICHWICDLSALEEPGATDLQQIRKAAGLSQAELAEKAGIPKRSLEKFDNGEHSINRAVAETVVKIADALGVRVADLME